MEPWEWVSSPKKRSRCEETEEMQLEEQSAKETEKQKQRGKRGDCDGLGAEERVSNAAEISNKVLAQDYLLCL